MLAQLGGLRQQQALLRMNVEGEVARCSGEVCHQVGCLSGVLPAEQCDSVEWDQMIGWQAHQDCLLQSCSRQACHQPRCYTVSSLLLLGLPS